MIRGAKALAVLGYMVFGFTVSWMILWGFLAVFLAGSLAGPYLPILAALGAIIVTIYFTIHKFRENR